MTRRAEDCGSCSTPDPVGSRPGAAGRCARTGRGGGLPELAVAGVLAAELARAAGFAPFARRRTAVRVERRSLGTGASRVRLDLYHPRRGARAGGLVASVGMFPQGLDDPRFRQLYRGLARAGFLVLAVDHPELRGFRFSTTLPERLVEAFLLAEGLPELAVPRRIGLLGFCLGGAAALLAAADAQIRERVGFVATFGAPYDLAELARWMITGRTLASAAERLSGPGESPAGAAVGPAAWWSVLFVANLAEPLGLAGDAPGLLGYAQELLRGDPDAVAERWDLLSPRAQELLAPLASTELAARERLLEELRAVAPPEIRSPCDVVAGIRCPVFLFHGRHDRLVPCSEGMALQAALAPRVPTRFLLSDLAGHTDLLRPRSLLHLATEGARLLAFVRRLLAAARRA
ncbi:MAG: hypothetical protein RBU45_07275 [Myxococcota bacterium]|nr:hypothetical protein [Myxococcota bacterium]